MKPPEDGEFSNLTLVASSSFGANPQSSLLPVDLSSSQDQGKPVRTELAPGVANT